jgi:hypothetical protein
MPNSSSDGEKQVSVFFYGSFVRMEVLARADFKPEKFEVAMLSGFRIHISPHAALSRSDQHSVYGILVKATHKTLNKLYRMDGVGVFLPEAVLVQTLDGKLEPALCYIPPTIDNKPADHQYLDRLVDAGRSYGFPNWYLEHLLSLRSSSSIPRM